MSYDPRLAPTRRFAAVFVAAIALFASGCSGPDAAAPSTTADQGSVSGLLSAADFSAYLDDHPDTPLINVHVPYDGHIAGTDAFIPFDSILDAPALPTDLSAPIAVYCRSGTMSAQAASDLVGAGHTNVIDLDGGMTAWAADGGSLIDDPAETDG